MELRKIKINPNQKFTVEADGFYGSWFEPETVRFPGRSMIVAAFFHEERKYKKECAENREKSWKDTLQFLEGKWNIQ